MRRAWPLALLAIGAIAGCRSYTLTQQDCEAYRDRLESWAKAKGKESQEAADAFMKKCPGTTISRGTHECLDKATDEASFFKCLE
jgi:hypothetical protein